MKGIIFLSACLAVLSTVASARDADLGDHFREARTKASSSREVLWEIKKTRPADAGRPDKLEGFLSATREEREFMVKKWDLLCQFKGVDEEEKRRSCADYERLFVAQFLADYSAQPESGRGKILESARLDIPGSDNPKKSLYEKRYLGGAVLRYLKERKEGMEISVSLEKRLRALETAARALPETLTRNERIAAVLALLEGKP